MKCFLTGNFNKANSNEMNPENGLVERLRAALSNPCEAVYVRVAARERYARIEQLGHGVDIIVTSFRQENPNLYLRRVSRHPKVCVASPALAEREGPFEKLQDLGKVPLSANVHFLRSISFRRGDEVADGPRHFAMLTDNSVSCHLNMNKSDKFV